jgi:hypothetical protein
MIWEAGREISSQRRRRALMTCAKDADDVRSMRNSTTEEGLFRTNGILKRHEEITETLDHYKQLMSDE